MPSDERVGPALEALAGARETFRSAVSVTVEEVRGLLETRSAAGADRLGRLERELGTFASGRIDPGRLAEVFAPPKRGAPFERVLLQQALGALTSIHQKGDESFRLTLESGARPVVEVRKALGDVGRAFGAARVVELVRASQYRAGEHGQFLEFFPFSEWNRAERGMAPPLVVELDGADLHVGGLADFLDGSVKLVLVVRGDSPPASLVRLITPGVLVLQTSDPGELACLADWPGPAVVALVPETAARFLHQPARDAGPARLQVEHLPGEPPRVALGGLTAFQQKEELRQLAFLADPARLAAAAANGADVGTRAGSPPAAPTAADPAGQLAAWLLQQTDLESPPPDSS
jgi:hypothetical protein